VLTFAPAVNDARDDGLGIDPAGSSGERYEHAFAGQHRIGRTDQHSVR
jgi:hypothetical protein